MHLINTVAYGSIWMWDASLHTYSVFVVYTVVILCRLILIWILYALIEMACASLVPLEAKFPSAYSNKCVLVVDALWVVIMNVLFMAFLPTCNE